MYKLVCMDHKFCLDLSSEFFFNLSGYFLLRLSSFGGAREGAPSRPAPSKVKHSSREIELMNLFVSCVFNAHYLGPFAFFSILLLLLRESILLRKTSYYPAIGPICFRCRRHPRLSFPILPVAATTAMAVKCCYCQPGIQQFTNRTLRVQFHKDIIQ